MKGSDLELFQGKTLSGLLEDIYNNSTQKRQEIKELLIEYSKMIQGAEGAVMIGPIVQGLLDTSVKNDDQLVKMAQIAQKLISLELAGNGEDGPTQLLSEEEKEQLISTARRDLKEMVSIDKEIKGQLPAPLEKN